MSDLKLFDIATTPITPLTGSEPLIAQSYEGS